MEGYPMNVLIDGEIVLSGTVGEGFFEAGFTAMDVVAALAEIGRTNDVTVRVNSGGGIAMEGVAIFNVLDSHAGKVTVVVDGIAASAASVIAMAGDEIIMRTGAVMMIHDPASITFGDAADHEKTIVALDAIGNAIADIYAERTGAKPEEMREAMKAETWLSARDAVKRGFADRTEKAKATEPTAFDYRLYQNAPERMVALAKSRDWSIGAVNEADKPAVTQSQKETPMADKEADGAAKENAETVVTEPEVTETSEQITARVRAEEQKRSADIVAACALVGKADKATAFISEGKSLSEVVASLQSDRASSDEIIARNGNARPDQPASWDKAIAKVNSRIK